MVFYVASNTYKEIISRTIVETEEILVGAECGDEIFLLKYVKENISQLSNLDAFIVDISCCQDVDDEIIQALETFRIMSDETKIILLAPNRSEGDDLLTKCFQMSIYNIICTDDFLEIKEQLEYCIRTGMQYKDAIRFKDMKAQDKVIIKKEVKQVVSKVMIGIAGSSARIGVTHNAVVLANYLRSRGYMVAIAEYNHSRAFKDIQESFDEKLLDGSYFTIAGVDYYPESDTDRIGSILGKSYNFILIDFGSFVECDRVTFNKSDVRIIIAGSKPWEVNLVNSIFELTAKETLMQYHFCFNFTAVKDQKEIRDSMGEISSVYFLKYTEDPFSSHDFTAAEKILKEYMPIKISEEKRGIFRRRHEK